MRVLRSLWAVLAFTVILSLGPAMGAAGLNPRACTTTTVATGGTAVTAVPAGVTGFYIYNPLDTAQQGVTAELLFVDPTGVAASTTGYGTSVALPPGTSFYGIPSSNFSVSVNAATTGHKFTCVRW